MKPCQGSLFNIGEQEVEQFTWVNDVRKYLLSQNLPVGWITEVVDKNAFGAVYVKDGKPWYKSKCPFYRGFWLHGSIGSVECEKCEKLLPGLQWDKVCSKEFSKCQFYEIKNGRE